MKVIFAHGFEGSPDGSKPTYMREELGWDVIAPILSTKGWTIENETDVLLGVIDENPDVDLISGSSMGGLAALNASTQRPDLNFKLLLFAPAFGLADGLRRDYNKLQLAGWKIKGSVPYEHRGLGQTIELGYDFLQAADKMSWPEPAHQCIIIHGTDDTIVPIERSRKMATQLPEKIQLIEVNDGHRLQQSLEHIAKAADKLLTANS